MAYEWLDTATDILNTGGNLLNAARPFIDIGGSIYDRNQTQNAINSGFNQYRGYAEDSMNTLGQVYNQGRGAIRPYLQAGRRGLRGYQNLLQNPNQITNDPGYQFRLNQGAEGMRRQLAAGGFRGSGNSAIELTKYGQDYATGEFNNALNRYLPMINVGQGATGQLTDLGRNYAYGVTGINEALGEAAAGAAVGNAGANSRMVTDFLGMTGGNPFESAADALNNVRSAVNGVNELGNLTTAGGGNPLAAAGESARQVGTGNWADPMAGPRTTAKMPTGGTNTLAGAGYTGTVGTATALGTDVGSGMYMGADGLVTDLTGMAAGEGATGTAATGPFGTGALGIAAIPVAMYGILEGLQNMKNFKGGAAEGAKIGKFTTQLQNDMKADPTGRKAQQTLTSLINGGLWAGEENGWVVGTLMKDGVLPMDSPLLYSSKSKFNPFANPGDKETLGKDVELQSYGIPAAQAKRYTDILTKKLNAERQASSRTAQSDTGLAAGNRATATPQELEFMKQIEARMTPQARLQTAMRTRQGILAADPRADVTKLNQFIRSATNANR